MSHYPMWSAEYKQVVLAGLEGVEGYQFKPLAPVGVFKHFQQFNYNKSKWGMDKNTEIADQVIMAGLKLLFEAQYILRMICGLLVNTWCVAQSRKIV